MSADAIIAVTTFNPLDADGSLDVTTTDLGGRTPKAVMIIGPRHNIANDPSNTSGFGFGMGFSDGTRNRCFYVFSQNGATSSNVGRFRPSNTLWKQRSTSGVDEMSAVVDTFITNGVRLTFTEAGLGASFTGRLIAVFFAGADLEAYVGDQDLGTGTSAIDVTAPGFMPDVVFGISDASSATHSTNDDICQFSIGIATQAAQMCLLHAELDNQAAGGNPTKVLYDTKFAGQLDASTDALTYDVTIGSFDSSGFSLTPSADASNDDLLYLAVSLAGRPVDLRTFTTPTSTGVNTVSNPGFYPDFFMNVVSTLLSANTIKTDTEANGLGVGVATSTAQGVCSGRTSQGQDPTSTGTGSFANGCVRAPNGTTTAAVIGDLDALDSGGVHVDYTTVSAQAQLGFALTVGPPPDGYNSGTRRIGMVLN